VLNFFDFKTAFHSLLKTKTYWVTIVLTLGITLGALVAMFNLNYQLLIKPLPYADQERLYLLRGDAFTNGKLDLANMYPYPAAVEAYKKAGDYFDEFALVYFGTDVVRSFPDSPSVTTSYVTPEYLSLANVSMTLGRSFTKEEGFESHNPVAIISYDTWQRLFKARADVLNETIRFGEIEFSIIGVTAKGFVEPQLMGPGRLTQIWLPWDYNLVPPRYRGWGFFNINQYLVGKIQSGQSAAQIEKSITSYLNGRFVEEVAGWASFEGSSIDFKLVSFSEIILGNSKTAVFLLFAGALVLLLIACANITNLILARAANQQRSMAIKAVLGAKQSHLFYSVLSEILLLLLPTSVLSLFIALGLIQLLQIYTGHLLPRLNELYLTGSSFLFAAVSVLFLAFIFAIIVSRQINYATLNSLMQSSGKGTGIQISSRVRKLLIMMQVMLTTILVSASLHILQQSIRNINQPVGFITRDLYQVILDRGTQADRPVAEQKNNLQAIHEKLLAHPQIENASITSDFPIASDKIASWFSYLSVDPGFVDQRQALLTLVDEHSLDLLGAEWLQGRRFTSEDRQTEATAIIVNQSFARLLQPDGDVMHKRYYWLNSDNPQFLYEIVGIIRDFSLPGRAEIPRMFVPQTSTRSPLSLLLQTKPNQRISKSDINELMAGVDSQYKVSELRSMNRAHQELVAQDNLSAAVTFTLCLLALSLAAIGIYAVLSYTVQLRQFEMGIRMAIGARPNTIFLQILKDNLAPVILGLAFASMILIALWLRVQQTTLNLHTTSLGWLLPSILILLLTLTTTLLSVWQIIRKPASHVLRGE
jgi:putative ABC transport system permease protein